MKTRKPSRRSRSHERRSFLGNLWNAVVSARPEVKASRRSLAFEQFEARAMMAIVGPNFPPMGGVAFSSSGAGVSDAGGRTFTFAPNLGDELFYYGPTAVSTSMDTTNAASGSNPTLVFNEANFSLSTSLLAAGVARWTGTADIDKTNSSASVRFTMTVTDLDGTPLPLLNTVGLTPPGLTGDLGSVLKVEVPAYRVNYLIEALDTTGGDNQWEPLNVFYNGEPSSFAAAGTSTNLSGGFWQDTVPTIYGTELDDEITINATTGEVTVNGVTRDYTGWGVPYTDSTGLIVDAGGGNDTITYIPGPQFSADRVRILGGESDSTSDALIVNLAAGAQTARVVIDSVVAGEQDISFSGVASAALDVAGVEDIVFEGSGSDDTLVVEPGPVGQTRVQNSPTDLRARLTSDTLPTIEWNSLNTFRLTGTGITDTRVDTFVLEDLFDALNYEYVSANDTLVLEGGSADNDWTIERVGANLSITASTGLGVRELTVLPGLPGEIRFNTGAGNDTLTVDNSAGLIVVPVVFNAGNGADELVLSGSTAVTTSTYSLGATSDSGTVTHALGATTQSVSFTGLEPVVDVVVAGSLVINANNADNAINYSQGSVATNGLVSIDGFEVYEFSNKAALTINGLAGSDTINLNNPTVPSALTGITVNGGDPTAGDALIVNGSAGISNNFLVAPTGLGAGTVTDSAPSVPVTFTTIEQLSMVGQSSDADSLSLGGTALNDTISLTPGPSIDSGTATGFNVGAGAFNFVPLTYSGFRRFLALPEAPVVGGLDTLIVNGTDADDVFLYRDSIPFAGDAIISVNGSPEIFSRAQNWILRGLGGNDTFNVDVDPASTSTSWTPDALRIEGGDSDSSSDEITYTATPGAGAVTVDLGSQTISQAGNPPVSFAGVETLTVNGVDGVADAFAVTNYGAPTSLKNLRLNAGDAGGADEADTIDINTASLGNDTLRYTPMTRFTSTLTRAEGGPQIDIAGFRGHNQLGSLSIAGGAGGEDRMDVYGQNSPTAFVVQRTSASQTLVEATLSAGTGSDEPGIPVDFANFESLVVHGGVGNDTLSLPQGAGGLIDLAGGVTFHGQSGIDRLTLTGATAVVATYTVGPNPDEGSITHVAGAVTQRVNFTGLEPVVDAVPGTLTINATNGNNAINYTQGSVAANGLVSIDSFETYEFTAKTTLTINALAGADTINLNNPTTPVGLTGITVNGGDPTVSDTLIVNGVAATVAVDVTAQTITGAGSPIAYNTIEHLTVVAGASTTLSVAGTSATEGVDYTLTPGTADDRGDIETIAVPISFVGFGAGSTLNFVGDVADGNDELTILGTNQNDSFSVAGVTGTTLVAGRATVTRTEIDELVIDGLNGDDQFTVAGNHPYISLAIHGNDPSASDELNFNGTGGLVTVNLVAATVAEAGFSPVSFSGVERLNVNAGGADAIVVGGPDDDEFVVTPDVSAVEVTQNGINTLVRLNNLDEFEVNGAGGNNELTVLGTNAADAIEVNVDEVAIAGRQTVDYANLALLRVDARGGNDTITVDVNATALVAVPLNIEGGLGLDHLVVAGTPIVVVDEVIYQVGPTTDRGRLTYENAANAVLMNIEFSGFEPVHDYIAADLTVLGNNADNAINYSTGPNSGVAGVLNPGGVETGLISVDAFETIEFGNKLDITIDGQAGDDDVNVVNATNPGASGSLTILGDGPVSGDDVQLSGTLGADTVSIEITGPDSAIVTINGAVTNIETTGGLYFDGLGGNDALTVLGIALGDNQFVFTPGVNPDGGSITGIDLTSNQAFLPIEFVNLGVAGSLTFDGNSTFDDNTLTILATSGHDTADVNSAGEIALTTPSAGSFVTISTIEIDDLVLEMLEGDDIVTVAGNHPYDTIAVEGGDPSASDILNFLAFGDGGLVTLEYDAETVTQGANGPVSFAGVELVNIDAAGNAVDINGTLDDDGFTVRPNDATGALVELAGNNTRVQVNNTLDLEIDGDDGPGLDNSITLLATAGDDLITLNANQIAVAGRLPVQYSDVQAIEVQGVDGEDTLTVDVSAGFPTDGAGAPIPIFYDGGQGFDDLVISGVPTQPVDEVIYGPGPLANTGRVRYENAANATLMVVDFLDLEPVLDLVPAANLTVNGTNADNAINYSLAAGGNGLVSVDGFETVEFANKLNLNLNGLAGSDVFNLGALGTPTLLATVNVDGGDPTESDQLVINGLFGGSTINFAPTAGDTGAVSVNTLPITNYTRTELVTYVGRSGGDLLTVTSPAGGAEITYVPGATMDSGTITQVGVAASSSLTPFEFRDLGVLSTVTFATTGGARSSGLDIEGTNNDDAFNVNAVGDVRVVKANLPAPVTPTILTPGVAVLRLLGLDGDDIFNVSGAHPIPLGIFVEGGNPSASDELNFLSSGGNVTVNYAATTITEGAFPPVSFSGIETINANVGNADIFVLGTLNDDHFTVTPDVLVATTRLQYNNTTLNANNLDQFFINGVSGDDTLTVNATATANTVEVTPTFVDITIPNRQRIDYLNFDDLRVFGSSGSDTFNVDPSATTTIFIDGGDPIGTSAGDALNIVGGGPNVFEPGPESDEGGFVFGVAQRVSFDHIEAIAVLNQPCVIILGTNGDDDITIIARDSSYSPLADGVGDFTASVNVGQNVLYTGVTVLYVDGLAGDDDIVLRTPAPNNAVWDVDVFVAGGPPSAATGAQGDVFELETPGAQSVVFTPSGSDSGTILLDANGDGIVDPTETLITLGTFVDACPPLNYDSSPGGIEQFVYEGETGGDTLTVVGSDLLNERFIHTPGTAPDAGRVDIHLGLTALLGVTYQNLGALGTIEIYGGGALPDFDTVVAMGTSDSDSMTLDFLAINEAEVSLASAAGTHIDLVTEDIEIYELRTLEGDDTIRILAPITVSAGGSVSVFAGGPSGSDALLLSGDAATAETVTISPDAINPLDQDVNGLGALINVSGIELLRYVGATGNGPDDTLIINPGAGDHWLRVDNAATSGDRVLSDSLPEIQFDGLLTFRIVEGGTGNIEVTFVTRNLTGAANYETDLGSQDTLVIEGDDGAADDYTVIQDIATGDVVITDAFGVAVRDLDTDVGRLQVNTLGGDDELLVNVDGPVSGAIEVPLTYDGGLGSDLITISGTPTTALGADAPFTSVTYTPGPAVTEGRLAYDGLVDMLIDFLNLEPVIDLVGALSLIVNGTNANNAINYSLTPGGNGLVSVDEFETIEFANKVNLTLRGQAGSDVINLNALGAPTGLASVSVEGGDPTDSDRLVVNGLFGGSTVNFAPVTADQGSITVATLPITNYSTVESVLYVGRSAGDLLTVTAPAGGSEISFVPGATEDSGFVTQHGFVQNSALTPFEFRNLGGFGELTFETAPGGTRLSGLQIHGTENDDDFVVDSVGDVVVVKSVLAAPVSPLIHTPGVAVLRLLGLNGDDDFRVPGNHPFPDGIIVEGGDPSASDVLTFTASAGGSVTVDLAAETVTQAGFSAVSYSGIEIIDLAAGGAAATTTIVASANDDDLTVTPSSATAGQVEIGLGVQQSGQVDPAVVAPLIRYSNLGTLGLAVDLAGGEDTLVVVGNALAQNWVVDALLAGGRSVSIDDVPNGVGNDGLITLTNTESLEAFGLEGNDAFTVIAGEIPVFVDGGDPIGVAPGDSINIIGAIGLVFEGPESDEGGFITAPGGVVSFDHIESLIVGPNGPCPFLILGTNGDDDITVIARDPSYIIPPAVVPPGLDGVQDFTVAINAGPEVLFIDEPDLFIDALAGDDDIVIRAPAPNDVDWDVNVRVAGGPPSMGETNDGDRLVLETPGFDILEFRPTGPDTGSLVINEDGVADYQAGSTDSIITFGPFVFICDDPLGGPVEFTYNSSPGGVELVEYDGELTAGAATDDITIFGTALNDTTTVAPTGVGPGGSGQGNFVSPASPLFNFRGFDALTVNGGTGGFDHVIFNATEGPDVITSDADSILLLTTSVTLDAEINKLTLSTLGGDDNVNLDLTIGGVNLAKTVDAGAGNDTVDLSGSIDADIFGGIGNDILIGSPATDNIFGGDGNDRIVGFGGIDFIYGEAGNDILGDLFLGGDGLPNTPDDAVNGVADDAGNDFFYGGDGSDLFIWEPGDGNDTIEGGANESDRVLFQGNAAGTAFTFNAGNGNVGGTRVEFLFGAAVDLDIAGVEEFDLNTLAGADTVTVNDLTQTDLRFIDIDLLTAPADADSVIVNGRAVSDQVDIAPLPAPNAAIVAITGLAYDIRISGATAVAGAGGDVLTFNGNAGNDTIVSNDGLNTLFAPEDVIINGGDGDDFISGFGTLNGDAGNDSLLGGAFVNVINGGAGEDFISGGGGGDDLNGDAGEDTFLADFDGVLDSYDGGTEFDTILIQATSGNDRIDAIQDNPTQIRFNVSGLGGGTGVVGGAGTQADALVEVGGVQTVEELEIVAGSGDDTIRVAHADSLVVAGFANDMLRFTVDGGLPGASDRLTVSDLGLGDTTVHRVGGNPGEGSYTMYAFDGNVPVAPPVIALPSVVYTGIEFASLNPIDPVSGGTGTGFGGRLFVFKHDPFEENNSRLNATHLGANDAINVDPVIDPGPDVPFELPGDEDWYRVVAQTTGTIDFQVYFREQGTLANGRAGLPGEGDLQLFAYDAQGELIPGFGGNESTVGVNDVDERIRIPVVAGQTYYFRLNGAGNAINIYNLTVVNEAPPVPYDLELDDRIVSGAVSALGTTTSFNSNLETLFPGQFPNDFFNGKVVSFKFDTTTVGLRSEESVVLDYDGATGVFTLAIPLSQAPAAGDTFQVESVDTGRNNTDNITRDNTPIIYFRLDDAIFLHDLPGNPVNDTPPDQVIPIPFNPQQTADPTVPGFRVAIFDEGQPTQPGQLPQVPIGYARQVAEGIYVFDFGIDAINPIAPNGPTTSRVLADGSHFLSAKVQIADPNTNFDTVLDDVILPIDPFTVGVQPPTGFGDRSVSLEINVDTVVPPVSFGDPGVVGDGLTADSDSFVPPNPHTIGDGVTNDLTPTFWGRAEADATVRLFVDTYRDLNGDGDFDFNDINGDGDFDLGVDIPIDLLPDGVFQPNLDVFIGQVTSIPIDGNQQEPNGFWKIESIINFNDPAFFATLDGLRTVFVTAEDVAGNVNDNVAPQELDIFIDTQGPQITDVEINNVGNPYDLFDPKPSNDGPTPLINSIFVSVRDLPLRVAPEFLIDAIKEDIAENPGHYLVVGDYNGIIPILDIDVINLPVVPGQPAEATIEIIFRTEGPDGVFDTSDDIGIALPDDRFTLTINDEGIRDYANNILDGESNADEPHDQDNPVPPILGVDGFPTGDGIPGGDFIARFTVDSRPEMGVWAGGAAWIDTNGNTSFDPTNPDFTNRDITYVLGYTSDNLFAGNFAAEVDDPDTEDIDETDADGFDKLAAYGRVGTSTFRWLIDTDNDGVPDIERTDPANVNGYPVAGNFSAFSGDEVGLFAGTRWHFDTDHNFRVDTQIAWPVAGAPIVGDFDGDGFDDLATFVDDVFSVDLSSIGPAGAVAALNNGGLGTGVNGTIERTFKFGFIGVGEKPVAADMNQDGIEDIGLWVPERDGVTPGEGAEWYFLISGITANNTPPAAAGPNPAIGNPIGPTITGTGDPTPGNYDVSGSGFYEVPTAPGVNPNYANGRLVRDALYPSTNIVRFDPSPFGNDLFMQFGNEFALPILGNFDPPVSRSVTPPAATNPRDVMDVNNDGSVTAADALVVIDHLNAKGTTPVPTSGFIGAPFMDIDANRFVSPADALLVIDYLNAGAGEGEGEAADAFFGEIGADQGEGEGDDLLALLAMDAMAQKKKK